MDATWCNTIAIPREILTFLLIACVHLKIANFVNKTNSLTCIVKSLAILLVLDTFTVDRANHVVISLVLEVSLTFVSIYHCFYSYICKLRKVCQRGGESTCYLI